MVGFTEPQSIRGSSVPNAMGDSDLGSCAIQQPARAPAVYFVFPQDQQDSTVRAACLRDWSLEKWNDVFAGVTESGSATCGTNNPADICCEPFSCVAVVRHPVPELDAPRATPHGQCGNFME